MAILIMPWRETNVKRMETFSFDTLKSSNATSSRVDGMESAHTTR